MPLKGKYGPYKKHCTSCIYCIEGARIWPLITCSKHLKQVMCSHWCEEHIDTRSNRGKELLKKWK